MNLTKLLFTAFLTFLAFYSVSEEDDFYQDRPEVLEFVEMMNKKHGFSKNNLIQLFSKATYQERVVRIMNRQPEGTMTWSQYKETMITPERIDSGKTFINTYKEHLKRAEDIYGVPAEIIASILGIDIDIDDTATNHSGSTTTYYGVKSDIVAEATGTATTYGIYSNVGSGDNNYSGIFTGGLFGIGVAAPTAWLEVEQGASGGQILFKLDNDDTDKVAMSVEAANIDKVMGV